MFSDENELSYKIRGCIFTAYNELGPGLLESVYETVLAYLLLEQGCDVKCQVPLPITFHGKQLNVGFRIDLLINNLVIVEIKSVEELKSVHHKQLLTYLKTFRIETWLAC